MSYTSEVIAGGEPGDVCMATAVGVAAVMVLLELAGAIPVVGNLVVPAVLLAGLGAVVLTYFGLKELTPVSRPD